MASKSEDDMKLCKTMVKLISEAMEKRDADLKASYEKMLDGSSPWHDYNDEIVEKSRDIAEILESSDFESGLGSIADESTIVKIRRLHPDEFNQ